MVFKSLLNVLIVVGWIAVWVIATRRMVDDKDPPTCDGLDCDSCPFPQCSEAEKERRNKAICDKGNQILDAMVDNPEPVTCIALYAEDGFSWISFGTEEEKTIDVLTKRFCNDTGSTPEEFHNTEGTIQYLNLGDVAGEFKWVSLLCVGNEPAILCYGNSAQDAEKALQKKISKDLGKRCSLKRIKSQFHVHTLPAKLDSCEMLRN